MVLSRGAKATHRAARICRADRLFCDDIFFEPFLSVIISSGNCLRYASAPVRLHEYTVDLFESGFALAIPDGFEQSTYGADVEATFLNFNNQKNASRNGAVLSLCLLDGADLLRLDQTLSMIVDGRWRGVAGGLKIQGFGELPVVCPDGGSQFLFYGFIDGTGS